MYVYFIQSGSKRGPIKIGKSINPEKRLKELQTGSHKELRLIAKIPCSSDTHAFHLEKMLHMRFKKFRINGEWFRAFKLKRIPEVRQSEINEYLDERLDDEIKNHMSAIKNE